MLTNIFRIGGLHQVSWFQLIPDVERFPPSISRKEKGRQDAASMQVMMAHMRLQGDGHLSAWTVSLMKECSTTRSSTTDERVKLWIFAPGRHECLSPAVHSIIMGLKVVGAGLWCAPGDHEEVGAALAEALRNRLERSLRSLSYVRFGDVFVKCRRHGVLESRKVLPTCELMFMGSEEALFVHVIVRRKRVRLLASQDLQLALAQQHNSDSPTENSLTVAVAPYGLSGRLTGCCPGDLVNVLYRSKLQAYTASSLPFRVVSSSSINGGGAVQSCFAEVWVGQAQGNTEQTGLVGLSPGNTGCSQGNIDTSLDQAREVDDEGQVKATEDAKIEGKVLIYPMEAVLAPVLPPVPSRTYLRRCWLQEWAGTHWLEDSAVPGLHWNRALNATSKEKPQTSGGGADSSSTSSSSGSGSRGVSMKSSSSRGSSSSSSGSSSSSESEAGTGEGELDADADSVGSKGANAVGAGSFKHSSVTSGRNSAQNLDVAGGNSGSKRSRGKVSGLSAEPSAKLSKISTSPGGELSALLDGGSTGAGRKSVSNVGELNAQGSLSMGTPREAGSQVGTPWDWTDEGMGLGISMGMEMQTDADILAEFGDFGDFFEDDVLGFGEPPGTAESQSMIFSLGDSVEGVNTPGTISMDNSDPMLLPILDFPTLEGFGGQPLLSMKEQSVRGARVSTSEIVQVQSSGQSPPPVATPLIIVDVLAKAEALLLFPPDYGPVELPIVEDEVAWSSTYIPESRKSCRNVILKDVYDYGPSPPPISAGGVFKVKGELVTEVSQNDTGDCKTSGEIVAVSTGRQAPTVIDVSVESTATNSLKFAPHQILSDPGPGHSGAVLQDSPVQDASSNGMGFLNNIDIRLFAPPKSTTPVLATELECALLQVSILCAADVSSTTSSTGTRGVGTPPGSSSFKLSTGVKDGNSDLSQNQVDQIGRIISKPPPAQKKKLLPSRIAGDADEDVQDGLRAAQVGVWRPVQAPKPLKTGNSTVDSRIGSSAGSPDTGNIGPDGVVVAGPKVTNWQAIIEAIPLLAQQAAVASDIALDGECGDGPLCWLAFQERRRHQCGCGPGMSHTGCGGMFSIRHCLDNAGVEYIDPLAAEVSPATVATLLQSDFRVAISSAFGEANTDGPLTAQDWCRGRVQADHFGSATTESKDGISTITMAAGEPITPPQCNSGNPGVLKIPAGQDELDLRRSSNSRIIESSSLSDQTRGDEQRRPSDDAGTSDSELQPTNGIHGATMIALPAPAFLVGYQDDWLKTSPNVLHLWEKAPLEPYAPPKPVTYYVLCLGLDSLVTAANEFFLQLSSVYETCKLGSHTAAVIPGPTGTSSGFNKQVSPGFMIVDSPSQPTPSITTTTLLQDFMASMDSGWNFNDFRKALSRVCKNVPISANPNSSQRDPDQGQTVVVYIVSPSSEPADILQILLDVSQCFGSALSEKDRRSLSHNPAAGIGIEECNMSPVVGFSTSRFVIQVLPAEFVLKASGTLSSELDTLKEVAFGVYNKARRIQRKVSLPESVQPSLPSRVRSGILQSSTTLPGMWKDCNTVRNSSVGMGLDSSLRSSWDGGWQSATSTSRFGDSTGTVDGSLVGDASTSEVARFLYEPLFILSEPGLPDPIANFLSLRSAGKDTLRSSAEEAAGSTGGLTPGLPETGSGAEGTDAESLGSGNQQAADLHCCYGWTDDWQWLVSVWTDARGELLDIHVLPLVGALKDAGLQSFFTQVLHQGLQLLTMAIEAGSQRPRNIFISRVGGFTERECQDWYRTVMMMGGDDLRRWPLQLWPAPSNGNSSQQSQDISFLSDRTLGLASSSSRPPSPNPSSSYTSRNKTSGIGMNLPRRQGQGLGLGSNQSPLDSKGFFQWVNSISLVSVRVEHTLQTVWMSDMTPPSGLFQGGSTSTTWPPGSAGNSGTTSITGVSTVKTLSNMGASYMLVPTNSPRVLSPISWQLPAAPPSSPPIAQLLQGSRVVSPLASAYVISPPPTPSPMSEFVQQAIKEEWPSTLHVGLIAFSGNPLGLEFSSLSSSSHSKSLKDTNKDSSTLEAHRIVQLVAAQVHALSWLTLSPTILLRHSPLPFHCHVAQRLRRLLSYLDVEHGFPRQPHTPV